MRVTIDDHGTLRRLQRTADRIGRLEVPHKRIAVFLDQWVHRNFDSDGALLKTGRWLPFVYGGRVMADGRIDASAKLLRDTGRLYAGFNFFADRNRAGIGNDVPYAVNHEEGLDWTPQRRMLPREDEVLARVEQIYLDYIEEVQR